MAKSNLRLVKPDLELRTITLPRRSNREMGREREHLTEAPRPTRFLPICHRSTYALS